MIQGTASDVGKTWLNTALCRLLSRKNIKVAPFKAWNMSLNSFVTPGGGEIGFAQALQARAAGVMSEVDMQPVLVKPRGDGKSQVMFRGRPGPEIDYGQLRKNHLQQMKQVINSSLERLIRKYELVQNFAETCCERRFSKD